VNQAKRSLKVNMVDLVSAFDTSSFEVSNYLGLETGEVVMTTAEVRDQLEEIHETYGDPESGAVDWPKVLPELDLADWEKESIQEADAIESNQDERYLAIPQVGSREGYNEMAEFIETVSDPAMASELERAIQGKGAFRRFKDVLLKYPQERERWFQFQNERTRQRVLDWLESEGIEPI
jgi:hypothetical protein